MQGDDKLQVETLDSKPEVMDMSGSATASVNQETHKLWPWLIGIAFMLMVITLLVAVFLARKPPQHNSRQANGIANQSVNTALLSPIASTFSSPTASSVLVNGQLQAGNGIIILPSAQPTNPTLGQMYLDQANHNLYFYNGTSFTSLGQTITNVTTIINGGPKGVTSLQGQTGDLTLSGGSGIAVNGTSIGVNNLVTLQGNSFNGPSQLLQLNSSGGADVAGDITLGASHTLFANNLVQTGSGQNLAINAGNDVITFTTGGISFTFPTSGGSTQQICTTGVTCASGGGQAVILAPGANPQSNASATDTSIFIRNTGAANLVQLQHNSSNVFVIDTNGNTTISGSLTVNTITPNANLTVGSASQQFTLQGNASSVISATSGVNTTTLSFATPTGNRAIVFPDAAGTICLSSGNCLGGTGGGANTALSNLTSVAINTSLLPGTTTIDLGSSSNPFRDLYLGGSTTANFKFTGSATASRTITIPDASGTVCLQGSSNCGFAGSSGSGNYIQNQIAADQTADFRISGTGRANTSLQAPLLDTPSGTATLNIGTNNATSGINLNQTTTIASGKSLTFNGGASNFDQSASSGTFATGSGAVSLNGNTSIASNKSFTANGASLFKDATNSATAFQIQNAAGIQILTADTTGNQIVLGKAGTLSGQLVYATSSGGSITIQPTASASNFTITLPAASGTVCLQGSSNCGFATSASGAAAFVQGGNSFGATAVLGTTDNNALQIITNGTGNPRATFTANNTLYLGNANTSGLASSPTSFLIQGTSSSASGTAGGNLTIGAGAGANITTGSAGGALILQGGSAGGTGNNNGGDVFINGGMATGTGTVGAILLQNVLGAELAGNVMVGGGSPTAKLHVSTAVAGLDLFKVTDATATAADVFKIADEGATTFANRTNSTAAFRIQNAGGANTLFNVDTTNRAVVIGDSTTANYITVGSSTGANPTVAVNASNSGGATGSHNANFLVVQGSGSNSGAVIKSAANGSYTNVPLFELRTNDNQAFLSAGSSSGNLVLQALSGQSADILEAQDSSGNNLLSIANDGDLTFGHSSTNTTHVISVAQPATASTAGNNLTVAAANGNGASGGSLTLQGGATASGGGIMGGSIVVGGGSILGPGGVSISGGAGGVGNVSGGSVIINGGQPSGTGSKGDVNLQSLFGTDMGNVSVGGVVSTTARLQVFSATAGLDILKVTDSTSSSHDVFKIADEGAAMFSNRTNSTTAFQIQNAAGNSLLTADTSGSQILLGKASSLNGKLVFNNASNTNTVTMVSGATSGSYSLTLPTAGPSTSQCLQTDSVTATQLVFGSCLGGSGAPNNAAYLTIGNDATLTNERAIAVNATNLQVTDSGANGSYTINTVQNISTTSSPTFASPTFTGTLSVQGSSITVGTASTTNGALVLRNATNGFAVTLNAPNQTTANATISLPNTAGVSDTICLQSLANCSGGGGGAAFVQGGNSFGATAVLGTTDANALQFITSGTGRALFDTSNHLYLGNAGTAGTAAVPNNFSLQATGSSTAGTAGANLTITSGAGASTTTGSAGGGLTLQGGNAGGTGNNNGGNVTIDAGTKTGSGANGTVSLGATNASAVTLGNSGSSTTTILGGSGINIGTGNVANTIQIGNTANAVSQTINIGNNATSNSTDTIVVGNLLGTSSTTIQGGTGASAVSVTTGAGGGVSIATGNNGAGNSGNITIGTGTATGTAGSVIIKNGTDATSVFKVQNAAGTETLFSIDTTARNASGGNLIKVGNSSGSDTATTILQVDSNAGALTSNLAALNGGIYYNSSINHLQVIENGQVKTLCNLTDLGCGSGGGGGVTLQSAYDNSSSPEIILNNGGDSSGITIQNNNGTPVAGSLFAVRDKAASGLGTAFLSVGSSGTITVNSSVQFTANGSTHGLTVNGVSATNGDAIQLTAGNAGATNGIGGAINLQAGNGATNGAGGQILLSGGLGGTGGAGGQILLSGGVGGAGGAGGDLVLQGGQGGGGSGNGGNLILSGGTKGGTGTAGSVIVKPQSGNDGTAFQVQNAGGTSTLFSIDTSGNGTVSIQASASGTINIGTVNSLSVTIGKSGGTGTLTVNGNATFNGTFSVNGHIISGNTSGSTTVTVGAITGCIDGSNGSVSISGNDTAGTVTITTGGSCSSGGKLATVSFANAYGSAPRVILTPAGANASTLQYYNNTSGTTSFTIDTNNTPATGTTYKYNYFVVQ